MSTNVPADHSAAAPGQSGPVPATTHDAASRDDAARTASALLRRLQDPDLVDRKAVVRSLPEADYILPGFAKKVLGRRAAGELQAVLLEVRTLNEAHLGMNQIEAMILVSGDACAADLRRRLRNITDGYAAARLGKTHPKDPNAAARFNRLGEEELPVWLNRLAHSEDTVNPALLHEVTDYVAWLLYRGTFAAWHREDPDAGPLVKRSMFLAPTSALQDYCEGMADHYAWHTARDVERVIGLLVERGGVRDREPVDAARARLAAMAAEIRSMRPFLVRDHNTAKCVAEVAPGLFVSWDWRTLTHLGMVTVHDDPRARLVQLRNGAFETALVVGHDGRLACAMLPWIDIDSLDLSEDLRLAANLVIVGALHDRLLDVHVKTDFGAAFERARRDASGPAGEEPPSVEAVGATFAVLESLAEEGKAGAALAPTPEPVRVRTDIRLERFRRLLGRLDCEVRDGDGSEVVAAREKRKVAFGRHRQLSASYAQWILRKLGVSAAEFQRGMKG